MKRQRGLTLSFARDHLTEAETAQWVLPETSELSAEIAEFHFDSRLIQPGDAFIATAGARVDGHDYARQAVERGAGLVLCERPVDVGGSAPVCVVQSSVAALRSLAGAWHRRLRIPTVVVAGSVGKTTTKEFIAALLRGQLGASSVLSTRGNQNGFLGIPLQLLRLRAHHAVAVLEVGIDAPGAMAQHMDLIRPVHALVTAIAEEHLDALGDLEQVAAEETAVYYAALRRQGRAFVNLDDERLASAAALLNGELVRRYRMGPLAYGKPEARDVKAHVDGDELVFEHPLSLRLPLPLPGAHNAANLLAATAVALEWGATPISLRRGLTTFEAPPLRNEIIELKNGSRIYSDVYNASPASMRAAMSTSETLRGDGALWMVLGDMLELGVAEAQYHRDLAVPIAAAGPAGVVMIGSRMAALFAELQDSPGPGVAVDTAHLETTEAVVDWLQSRVKPGDLVMVKGSRGLALERVVEGLRAAVGTPTTPESPAL